MPREPEQRAPLVWLCYATRFFFLEISFITHSTEEKTRFGPKAAARSVRNSSMPLALVSGIKEAEPHLVKQLLYSGIVKDLDFT
jgi:hypothetical protein